MIEFFLGIFIILFASLLGLLSGKKNNSSSSSEYTSNDEEYMDPITKGRFEKLQRENAKLREKAGYTRHSSAVDTAARIYVFKFKAALIFAIIYFIFSTYEQIFG